MYIQKIFEKQLFESPIFKFEASVTKIKSHKKYRTHKNVYIILIKNYVFKLIWVNDLL